LNILPLKAKEIVCKLLKVNDSKYFDLVFEGQNLLYAARKDDGETYVHKVNGVSYEVSHLVSGGFDWGLDSHYYPKWMSTQCDFTKSSHVAHMSSLENKELLKKKRDTTTKDQKDNDEYILYAIHSSNFSLDKAQTWLVKGYYIPVKNPLHFVATHLGVSTKLLVDAIRV
jgi:hypothetical protein